MPTALITGANRGIGLELTRQFKEAGYDLIAVCRQPSQALQALGVRIEKDVELTERASLENLAQRLGPVRLDLLVNNAGVLRPSSLDSIESQLDDFRLQYEVNALAPLRVTSILLPHLKDGGKVVIITSRMGSMGDNSSGGHYAYRMSKAAANAGGVSLAHELKKRSIAVGLLHPGYVRTEMTGLNGDIGPAESAAGLFQRIEELTLETTGRFRHANGETLPW